MKEVYKLLKMMPSDSVFNTVVMIYIDQIEVIYIVTLIGFKLPN